MPTLVDIPVWSLAFRRQGRTLNEVEFRAVVTLKHFISDKQVRVIGPIRQELLSGIRDEMQFERLRLRFRDFEDEPLTLSDFEAAADIDCRCRKRGIAATAIDVLICSVAISRDWQIFTIDNDFNRYSKIVPLRLAVAS